MFTIELLAMRLAAASSRLPQPTRQRLTGLCCGAGVILLAAWQPPVSTEWRAALTGRDGRKVAGTASVRPSADGKGIDVQVTITGDTPGATRPWHVHAGRCDQMGAVVGGGRAYPPMVIDAKGMGAAKATVPATLADSSRYVVNLHDAAAAMGISVACGDLVRP